MIMLQSSRIFQGIAVLKVSGKLISGFHIANS